MSTKAEVTYAIVNDRPSIMIRLSAQEEGETKPDLCGMLSQIQEAITEFQANKPQPKLLSNAEVVVQDVPHPAPATPKPQALPLTDNSPRKPSLFQATRKKGFLKRKRRSKMTIRKKILPGVLRKNRLG